MNKIIKIKESEFKNIIENTILKEQEYNPFNDPKAHLLMKFLWENEPDEEFSIGEINLIGTWYGLDRYRLSNGSEYIIGTDEEAQKTAEESIKNEVWTFNPDFIIKHSSILEPDDKDMLLMIMEKRSERANDLILRLIDHIDDFIEDAIQSDGRGPFISRYDNEEHEFEGYYIYRIT